MFCKYFPAKSVQILASAAAAWCGEWVLSEARLVTEGALSGERGPWVAKPQVNDPLDPCGPDRTPGVAMFKGWSDSLQQ